MTTPSSGAETVKQSSGTTLHDRIAAELDRRLAVANAATPGPWEHVDYAGDPNLDVAWTESTFRGAGSVITWGEGVEAGAICAPNGDLYPRSGYSPKDDMAHIALHDPADALRRYAGELEVLDRHAPKVRPSSGRVWCVACNEKTDVNLYGEVPWPCPEIRSLASRLRVSVDG